jgi:hypothetical protein
MRSTMYNVPCTNDMLKQTHLPFALTLMPFAQLGEKEVSFMFLVVPFYVAKIYSGAILRVQIIKNRIL